MFNEVETLSILFLFALMEVIFYDCDWQHTSSRQPVLINLIDFLHSSHMTIGLCFADLIKLSDILIAVKEFFHNDTRN